MVLTSVSMLHLPLLGCLGQLTNARTDRRRRPAVGWQPARPESEHGMCVSDETRHRPGSHGATEVTYSCGGPMNERQAAHWDNQSRILVKCVRN